MAQNTGVYHFFFVKSDFMNLASSSLRPSFNPLTLTINTTLKKNNCSSPGIIEGQNSPFIFKNGSPSAKHPRIRAIEAEQTDRRRKRSCSEEQSPLFNEGLYDKAIQFMDYEGLDIMSPTRTVKKKKSTLLRPCSLFQKQASLDISTLATLNDDDLTESETSSVPKVKLAMPKFLIRRAASFGMEDTKNELSSSLIHMKAKARSTLCNAVVQDDLEESKSFDNEN